MAKEGFMNLPIMDMGSPSHEISVVSLGNYEDLTRVQPIPPKSSSKSVKSLLYMPISRSFLAECSEHVIAATCSPKRFSWNPLPCMMK